VSGMIYFMLV